MPEINPLAPLLAALRDLVDWFAAENVSGMVIGGVAASILGRPRATRDLDAVTFIEQADWELFLKAGARHGFQPRNPDALDFAGKSRVLLIRHTSSGIDVDVSFGALPFEKEAIARRRWVEVGGVNVPLPRPEDLIVMKAIANRTRDKADIEAILDAHPKLDLRHVRRYIREFASVLEMPEILSDFEAAVAKQRRKKKRPP